MKYQLKRRSIILLVSLLIIIGISYLLNLASYDPDFSIVDAISGATKHSASSEMPVSWEYSTDYIALQDNSAYIKNTVHTENGSYVLLQKADLSNETLLILSNKENQDYDKSVQLVAKYYEDLGYTVDIREYSETMMLSLAHAGHFDLFLLQEDASS